MEPIKITDKLTLRQEALRLAIMQAGHDDRKDYVLSMAKDFESYLQGSADIPEYSDHDREITDMLAKMQESFKPNPWISADSEMKPAKGVKVYVRTKSGSFYSGEYDDGWYVTHKPVGDEIIAWMPIPKYEPTL